MKRLIAICLMAVLFGAGSAMASYSGGTGEPNNPYIISTVADWQELMTTSDDWGQSFLLTADIDLAGVSLTPVGIYPDNPFIGAFDGNDYVIHHADINLPSSVCVGLFGYIDYGGQIKNLGVIDVNITGYWDVGGLVGCNLGSLTACYATGAVTGTYSVGGLVGGNLGDVNTCYATGSVSGIDCCSSGIGGLMGWNEGSVTDCHFTGSVNGSEFVGSLVGENGSSVTSSYAIGSVSGDSSVGGLVGDNWHSITSCYSAASVSGWERVGGLVGWNEWPEVTSCYATGSVRGYNYVGGLIGYIDIYGGASACYATGTVSGNLNTGGLVGDIYGRNVTVGFWDTQTSGQSISAGGTGKTTAEMKTKSTFTDAGWDFVETWGIGENQTYPYLRTESAADLNNDKKVDFADFAIFAQHWLEGVNP